MNEQISRISHALTSPEFKTPLTEEWLNESFHVHRNDRAWKVWMLVSKDEPEPEVDSGYYIATPGEDNQISSRGTWILGQFEFEIGMVILPLETYEDVLMLCRVLKINGYS